jgi:GNAT superfamily N-acetyltransferase
MIEQTSSCESMKQSSIRVEPARKDDEEEILEVINSAGRELFRQVIPEEHFIDPFLSIEQLRKMMTFMTFYVHRKDGDIIALTSFSTKTEQPDTCWLPAIHVLPSHQRTGIGTLMLKFTLDLAIEKGFKKIRLETDSEAYWAMSFYQKFGFDVVEREKTPWGYHVWLEKNL